MPSVLPTLYRLVATLMPSRDMPTIEGIALGYGMLVFAMKHPEEARRVYEDYQLHFMRRDGMDAFLAGMQEVEAAVDELAVQIRELGGHG